MKTAHVFNIKDSFPSIIDYSYITAVITAYNDTIIQIVCNSPKKKELEKKEGVEEQRKDDFISMAAHELKTPVTSLKAYLQLVQRMKDLHDPTKIHNYLDRMSIQIEKLTALINDLLDVSRLHQGELEFEEEVFEFDTLVHDTIENLQLINNSHKFIIEGKTETHVFGDRGRIEQVLVNILGNAVKYSPGKDKVIVVLSEINGTILVKVKDFGIGISQEHHKKIFERFYRAGNKNGRLFPGLGVGLYISSQIAKRHGGKIWLDSEEEAGTTFYLELPSLYNKELVNQK